jgi:alkylhydroperoxidase family enzyme
MSLLLAPIDKPGFLMRIVYRIARHRYGRILMPLRVIYSRAPALLTVGLHIEWMREHALAIEPGLRALVIARVSSHHRCEFCSDLGLAIAMRKGIDVDRFQQLDAWHTSLRFSPRERAALAWVDDILDDGRIKEGTLVSAREVFSERELVELTWLQASEAYFNLQARPLGVPSDGLASPATAPRRKPH